MTSKSIKPEVELDSHATSHQRAVISDPITGATAHAASGDLETFVSELAQRLDDNPSVVDPWDSNTVFTNEIASAMAGLTLDGIAVGSALGEWSPRFIMRSQSSGTGWQEDDNFGKFKLRRNNNGVATIYSHSGRYVFFGFELE